MPTPSVEGMVLAPAHLPQALWYQLYPSHQQHQQQRQPETMLLLLPRRRQTTLPPRLK